jgi:hypothetical protein
MTMSQCGRFWFDVFHDPIDDWCVEFIPARRGNVNRIKRGGFASRDRAEVALWLLTSEWCDVRSEVDCGGQ